MISGSRKQWSTVAPGVGKRKSLQCRGHVARGDGVDPDARIGPLNGQRGGEVLDRRLGRVVRSNEV